MLYMGLYWISSELYSITLTRGFLSVRIMMTMSRVAVSQGKSSWDISK